MATVQTVFRTAGQTDAAGDLTLSFLGRDSAPVRVRQVTCEMPGGGGAACSLRLDGLLISPMVPTGDAAVGEPEIWVDPGVPMTLEWVGAPAAGLTGTMGVIYDYGPAA